MPLFGGEHRQLIVGVFRARLAALAIGEDALRHRAAIVEGHDLHVAAAEVDQIPAGVDRRLSLGLQLVEYAFEFVAAVQRHPLPMHQARLRDAERDVGGEACRANDPDRFGQRIEDGVAGDGVAHVEPSRCLDRPAGVEGHTPDLRYVLGLAPELAKQR